jgi:hypothetical protein
MDSSRVQALIDRALSEADAKIVGERPARRAGAARADYAEWHILGRRARARNDPELACAHLYLKMRQWTAAGGLVAMPACRAYIRGDATIEGVLETLGQPAWIAVRDCPLHSPGSWAEIAWAMKGAKDGLNDFYAETPDAAVAASP